jgi:hypothetical protein
MPSSWNRFILLSTMILSSLGLSSGPLRADPSLPETWRKAWERPTAGNRPLQILHRISALQASPEGMRYFQERGLGGLVTNVAFDKYLQSEKHWMTLRAVIEACRKAGLQVWLYDEEGYPSGAAGGLVLKANPAFEARVLVRDPGRADPFFIRPAYEHTHASNNFHAARRYINLLDDRPVAAFLGTTHQAYWERLQPYFGSTITAFFTDEPSLMAVDLGQLPESVRTRVRVADPLDPSGKPLPGVPWSDDLAEKYRRRFHEELLPLRPSLFGGDRAEDRRVRRQFWSLVADLVAERYYGQIQTWCGQHRVASSGHKLHEESLLHHVPLDGNGLKVLCRMDIPGLDMLSSNPEVVLHSGWLTAALPASAALLEGRRRVMTEVSDFSEKMSGRGPVGLAEMRATAAWQACWGVTEFTLYYGLGDRSAETIRAYGDFVGRLNALLAPARPAPQVLLYYPIHDLWEEYLPVAGPLDLASQSVRARQVVHSFMRLGQTLQRHQVPFTLIDHEHLAKASVEGGTTLTLQGHHFKTLLVPQNVHFPAGAAALVQGLNDKGGGMVRDRAGQTLFGPALCKIIGPAEQLVPSCEYLALGRFERDGRTILLLVNVGRNEYQGVLRTSWKGDALALDPATGNVKVVHFREGAVHLSLAGLQTLFLIGKNPRADDPPGDD